MSRVAILTGCIVVLVIVVIFGWRTPDKTIIVNVPASSSSSGGAPAPPSPVESAEPPSPPRNGRGTEQEPILPAAAASSPRAPSPVLAAAASSKGKKLLRLPTPRWAPGGEQQHQSGKSKIVLISFIDSSGSNNVGVMYGAASRLCYAKEHGYHSVIYGDKDLEGWVPPTSERQHAGYRPGSFHRMWSKNFLLRRAMFDFNLTERDWVMWMDSDTLITRPDIPLETMIQRASVRRKPDGTVVSEEPDMIVADTYDGINNGNMLMRKTKWSLQFLERWWQDQNSNHHAGDNGPFMHSVLVELAESRGIKYKNECHMKTNPAYGSFHPFAGCYTRYLHNVVCKGDPKSCVSRVPHSNKPWDSAFKPGFEFKRDWEWGYILAYSPHIGGNNRINDGLGWRPCALWTEDDSFILHMAGHHGESRNRTLREYALRFKTRMSPRCY